MLSAHRQEWLFVFLFFEQQKNPHFNSISLPPLWGNLYRKSTHLWPGRVSLPELYSVLALCLSLSVCVTKHINLFVLLYIYLI